MSLKRNLEIINSPYFNSILECEDGEKAFETNEKLKRLYNGACVKLGLIDFSEEDEKYIMSEEINFQNYKKNFSKLNFTEIFDEIEFFKRLSIENRDDIQSNKSFFEKINSFFHNVCIISEIKYIIGYNYIFYFAGKFRHCGKTLQKFTELRYLDLSGSYLENLKFIEPMTKLEYLDLSNIHTCMNSFSPLRHLTELKYLDLSSIRKDSHIPIQTTDLIYLTKLEYLNISDYIYGNSEFPVEDFTFIENLTNLRNLTLHMSTIGHKTEDGKSQFFIFKNLAKLEYLDLSNIIGDTEGKLIPSLLSLVELKYLDLSFNDNLGTKEDLSLLSSLPKLKYLNLCKTSYEQNSISNLKCKIFIAMQK